MAKKRAAKKRAPRKRTAKKRGLTRLQARFIEEYCIDFNGAAAARRAGYSERTARQIAHRLLKDPLILAAVEKRMDEMSMSAAEALKRLTDIARSDIADFVTIEPNGRWSLDLEGAKKAGKTNLIHELAYDRAGNPKLRLHNAHEALRDIGRARGIFVEKHEVTGKDGGPIETAARVQFYLPDNGRNG